MSAFFSLKPVVLTPTHKISERINGKLHHIEPLCPFLCHHFSFSFAPLVVSYAMKRKERERDDTMIN
jgi:hypothetical protein